MKIVTVFVLLMAFLMGFLFHSENLAKPCVDEDSYVSLYLRKERMAIMEQGDTLAYKVYMDSVRHDSHLSRSNTFLYSLKLATYYDYAPANYDAYETIMKVYPGVDSMDVETRKLCLFLLKRGADRGEKRCLQELKRRNINYRQICCFTESPDQYVGQWELFLRQLREAWNAKKP